MAEKLRKICHYGRFQDPRFDCAVSTLSLNLHVWSLIFREMLSGAVAIRGFSKCTNCKSFKSSIFCSQACPVLLVIRSNRPVINSFYGGLLRIMWPNYAVDIRGRMRVGYVFSVRFTFLMSSLNERKYHALEKKGQI